MVLVWYKASQMLHSPTYIVCLNIINFVFRFEHHLLYVALGVCKYPQVQTTSGSKHFR